jgi:hypothetical protein
MGQRNKSQNELTTTVVPLALGRTISEPNASSLNLPSSTIERSKSSSDLIGSSKDKRVQFSNTAKVVLIPTRNEYRTNALDDQMWWKEDDYLQFKRSALTEISHLFQLGGGDLQNLIAKFYQSEHEEDQKQEGGPSLLLSASC